MKVIIPIVLPKTLLFYARMIVELEDIPFRIKYNEPMCKVSVLMPCYNAAAALPEALQSLAAQTFQDFEIVAVDDGSTDDTPVILADFAGREPRLRVLRIDHGGIIAALNHGLARCRGDYIARMDADDRCHPERLRLQVDHLDSDPDLAVSSCLVRAFPADSVREGFRIYIEWLNGLVSDEDIRREIFVESPIPHPSAVVRRDWLDRMGDYQERGWAEDYDLWLRMAQAGARFGKVPQVLLDWRESPDRLTRQDSRYSLENFLRAKAHYLAQGPLAGRDAVILWGAGMMGRRLGKQLQRNGIELTAYIDIDPRKIGNTRRGAPILAPEDLLGLWRGHTNPVLLAAVGARGARALIRSRLTEFGFVEGQDWWGAA
jgi:glycosyltransferase involved in cell wall biosynthesis